MSIDRADKKYWKLGFFYVNKEDKSLLVPKRFGMGTTFNLAHPISFVIIATFVAVMIVLKFKKII